MNNKNIIEEYDENSIEEVVTREMVPIGKSIIPCDIPSAYILAGQPGAGKNVLTNSLLGYFGKESGLIVNADEYRRFHPHYHELYVKYGFETPVYTAPFAHEITEKLIDCASDRKVNLIVEGTGRTVDIPLKTATLLKQEGYTVKMAVIAARPEFSLASILLRYCEMIDKGTLPRATAITHHDDVVSALPGNLDRLKDLSCFEKILIYDRSFNCLYDSVFDTGYPSVPLTAYWNSEWSKEEYKYLSGMLQRISDKCVSAAPELIKETETLRYRMNLACKKTRL